MKEKKKTLEKRGRERWERNNGIPVAGRKLIFDGCTERKEELDHTNLTNI